MTSDSNSIFPTWDILLTVVLVSNEKKKEKKKKIIKNTEIIVKGIV